MTRRAKEKEAEKKDKRSKREAKKKRKEEKRSRKKRNRKEKKTEGQKKRKGESHPDTQRSHSSIQPAGSQPASQQPARKHQTVSRPADTQVTLANSQPSNSHIAIDEQ